MYECHITIEPLDIHSADPACVEALAKTHRFKLAKLLMQNREASTPERSMYDTFMTGHDDCYRDLETRMLNLIEGLSKNGFDIWRYKIELIVLDSRGGDIFGVTTPQPEKAIPHVY